MSTFKLTTAVTALLGTTKVNAFADMGRLMFAVSEGQDAIDTSAGAITNQIIAKCRVVVRASDGIASDERPAFLRSEMSKTFTKCMEGYIEADDVDIATWNWPEPRTIKGEKKKGLQIVKAFYSLNAPEINEPPTMEQVVPGRTWKMVVSNMGKLWKLSDDETVLAVMESSNKDKPERGLKEQLAIYAPAPEKDEPVVNDLTNILKAIEASLEGYVTDGNTLTADQLLSLQEVMAESWLANGLTPVETEETATAEAA